MYIFVLYRLSIFQLFAGCTGRGLTARLGHDRVYPLLAHGADCDEF